MALLVSKQIGSRDVVLLTRNFLTFLSVQCSFTVKLILLRPSTIVQNRVVMSIFHIFLLKCLLMFWSVNIAMKFLAENYVAQELCYIPSENDIISVTIINKKEWHNISCTYPFLVFSPTSTNTRTGNQHCIQCIVLCNIASNGFLFKLISVGTRISTSVESIVT